MSEFSNGLSPAQAERLALLAEECGEVIQAVGKILRHGYRSSHPDFLNTNRAHLAMEIGHLHFATDLMIQNGDVEGGEVGHAHREKIKNIPQYLHHEHLYAGRKL